MNKRARLGILVLAVAAQGCTLKIPGGIGSLLQGGLLTPGTTQPAPEQPTSAPGQPPVGHPPVNVEPVKPGVLTDPACSPMAGRTLAKYDRNQDGRWDYTEFLSFYASTIAAAAGCSPVGGAVVTINTAGVISAEAGYRIKQADEPQVISNDDGLLISNNAGTLIANNGGGVIANNGGTLIANNGGGLIADHGGGELGTVVTTNGGVGDGVVSAVILVPGQDGALTATGCFSDPKSAFGRLDVDHDGGISMAELCRTNFVAVPIPVPMPVAPPTPMPPVAYGCDGDFARADADQDGWVSYAEFLKVRGPGDVPGLISNNNGGLKLPAIAANGNASVLFTLRPAFNAMDTDGDGELSPDEWCGRTGMIEPTPTPGWGQPSPVWEPSPFPSAPTNTDFGRCGALFSTYDTDGDGFVSLHEYIVAREAQPGTKNRKETQQQRDLRFQNEALQYDTDSDLRLSLAEFLLACPSGGDTPVTDPAPTNPPIPVGACGMPFDPSDKNGDGFLSYDEFADAKWNVLIAMNSVQWTDEAGTKDRLRVEAKTYDKDGDGKLSAAELGAACTPLGSNR